MVDPGDVLGLHRVLPGLDRDSVEMPRSPPSGACSRQEQRCEAMVGAS